MNGRRTLTLARRNIFRHRRRSAITFAAVLLGVMASVCLDGYCVGAQNIGLDEVVSARTGALQAHRRGYLANLEVLPISLSFPYDVAKFEAAAKRAGATGFAGRLRFTGAVSNGLTDAPFAARGVDLQRETQACPNFGADTKPGGAAALDPARDEAVLGQALAKSLGIGTVTLSATSAEGRMNAVDVVVKAVGTLHLPYESQRGVTVPLRVAQELVGLPGEVTEVAFGAADGADLDAIAGHLETELGPEFEVHTWQQLEPYLFHTLSRLRRTTRIVEVILLLVVLTGIASTMTMSVHERKQEIGTMLALGLRRRAILRLFVTEAWLIGLAGALAGAVLGASIITAFGLVGVELKQLDNPVIMHPAVEGLGLVMAVAVTSLGAVAAALVQARRAANLDPVEALRA